MSRLDNVLRWFVQQYDMRNARLALKKATRPVR